MENKDDLRPTRQTYMAMLFYVATSFLLLLTGVIQSAQSAENIFIFAIPATFTAMVAQMAAGFVVLVALLLVFSAIIALTSRIYFLSEAVASLFDWFTDTHLGRMIGAVVLSIGSSAAVLWGINQTLSYYVTVTNIPVATAAYTVAFSLAIGIVWIYERFVPNSNQDG